MNSLCVNEKSNENHLGEGSEVIEKKKRKRERGMKIKMAKNF